jgi:hypothetical protein
MKIKTKDDAIAELKKLQAINDKEYTHHKADDVLCSLLVLFGCEDVVREYKKVGKWYA